MLTFYNSNMTTFDPYNNHGNEAWQPLMKENILVKKIEMQIVSTLSEMTQPDNGEWKDAFWNMVLQLHQGPLKDRTI